MADVPFHSNVIFTRRRNTPSQNFNSKCHSKYRHHHAGPYHPGDQLISSLLVNITAAIRLKKIKAMNFSFIFILGNFIK